MKYGFYSKFDKRKEIVYMHTFATLNQAVDFFAKIKGLPLDEFHSLFEVVMVDNKNRIRNGRD
jgi:hypothetical protein